jgi:hypothetical protein
MPQKAAGWRMEPPVSVPIAAVARCAATATAEPPDEPPGTRSLPSAARQGLIAGPQWLVTVEDPMANSSRLALPSMTAPASRNLALTVDS